MDATVFDAWAVVALLKGERAASAVGERMKAPGVVMSSINLGEALCAVARTHGWDVASDRAARLRRRLLVEDPDWSTVTAATRLKARGGLSFADAFCVATAQRHRAPVWTGDPELVALSDLVDVVDLR